VLELLPSSVDRLSIATAVAMPDQITLNTNPRDDNSGF
jgi:hypothetical protein